MTVILSRDYDNCDATLVVAKDKNGLLFARVYHDEEPGRPGVGEQVNLDGNWQLIR